MGQERGLGATARRGPAVWRDLDQQALDAAYDQTVYAPNRGQILERYAANSAAVRARLGPPRRLAYGDAAAEQVDLFLSDRAGAPINVFVHGGAWRGGMARDYAFFAELFVRAGAHLAVLDFANVLETGGDLVPMAEQVRRGVAWVRRHAASFGGDPDRIFLSGHSSGAHLAAVALTTDWGAQFGLPDDVVRGALLCSGMFDLAPVRRSARSAYVRFTDEVEAALSPQRHLARLTCPIIAAYGTLESPEFQRQTREFAAALRAAGTPVDLLVAEATNHFEVLETLANPYGLLGRAVLAQMRLG